MAVDLSNLTNKATLAGTEQIILNDGGIAKDVTVDVLKTHVSASPTLTGVPVAPTAAAGANTTQLATTAHVFAERSNAATLTNKTLTGAALSTEAINVVANNLPAIRPTLNLDFANSRSVDPRITCVRSSTATRTNEFGVMEVVAANVPRLDFDPVTGGCKGLLVEEARTNLLTYSEQLDNAAWGKANATITANAVAAPDGTTTADKLVENAGVGAKQLYRASNVAITTGTSYALSLYIKAGERSKAFISFSAAAFGASTITVDTVALTAIAGGANAPTGVSITPVGSDWFRVVGVASATSTVASSPAFDIRPSATAGDAGSYTGDGASGIYLWGAQLEAGSFATSYIPTVASQVTRAADVASMTGTNFSSWYRQDEGSITCDFTIFDTGTARVFVVRDSSITSNSLFLAQTSSGLGINFQTYSLGVNGANQTVYIGTGGAKTAFSWGPGEAQSVANGSTVISTTAATPVGINQITFGDASSNLNGHIKNLAYFPKRLTNLELQSLSA